MKSGKKCVWKDWVVAWDDTLVGSLIYVFKAKAYMNLEKIGMHVMSYKKEKWKEDFPSVVFWYDMDLYNMFIDYLFTVNSGFSSENFVNFVFCYWLLKLIVYVHTFWKYLNFSH